MEATRRHPIRGARFARSHSNVVLTGTAAGLGERVGVDPMIVRAAFAVVTLAGGFGAALYVLLWAASAPAGTAAPQPPLPGPRQVGGVAGITASVLVVLRDAGLWFGDTVVWPAALTALGASVIWVSGEASSRAASGSGADRMFSGAALLRIAIGGALILSGMATAVAGNMTFTLRRAVDAAVPLAVTVAGLSLVFGPWLLRLAHQATRERRERIRAAERADMAAHLHDSVLQTLALIQRANTHKEAATLARVQERELRSWLFGKSKSPVGATLDAAVDALAGRIEQTHQVNVESVVVGDAPLDDRLRALVHAAGEAITNAALHSGSSSISVYVEVEGDEVVAYVRDQGRGFDPASIPRDRRGIRDSVTGRMARNGGSAAIVSAPGAGAEVQLRMPLR